jgi:hypothetical protein
MFGVSTPKFLSHMSESIAEVVLCFALSVAPSPRMKLGNSSSRFVIFFRSARRTIPGSAIGVTAIAAYMTIGGVVTGSTACNETGNRPNSIAADSAVAGTVATAPASNAREIRCSESVSNSSGWNHTGSLGATARMAT